METIRNTTLKGRYGSRYYLLSTRRVDKLPEILSGINYKKMNQKYFIHYDDIEKVFSRFININIEITKVYDKQIRRRKEPTLVYDQILGN